MQDKNVSHEINLGWLLSWCFWSWAASSQSNPAVANTNSALPPKAFAKDGFCESRLEPFLFLGQILSLCGQTQGRFHFYPVWRSSDGSEERQTQLELHATSAEKGKWAELPELGRAVTHLWCALMRSSVILYSCISNCVWTLRSCKETGINCWKVSQLYETVLNFISGNGQIRFKWLFKWLSWRKKLGDEISALDTHCLSSALVRLLHSCFHWQQCHFPVVCPLVLESLGLVSHGTVGCSAHGHSNARMGINGDSWALAIINT